MIHPVGLGGRPVDGHRCTAVVNASWTDSSAMPMSPKTRTRTATARPYSSRNTRSISHGVTAGMPVSAVLGVRLQRPNFDRKGRRPGELPAPLERRVEIGRLDDREP